LAASQTCAAASGGEDHRNLRIKLADPASRSNSASGRRTALLTALAALDATAWQNASTNSGSSPPPAASRRRIFRHWSCGVAPRSGGAREGEPHPSATERRRTANELDPPKSPSG